MMSEPQSFEDLAASRRDWIDGVLRRWCQRATWAELKQAALEWHDFAGRADAAATLWTWAWERHPAIVHDDLPGVNETHCVIVTLRDGTSVRGFPDGRRSQRGHLLLLADTGEAGPFSIDEIENVRLAE